FGGGVAAGAGPHSRASARRAAGISCRPRASEPVLERHGGDDRDRRAGAAPRARRERARRGDRDPARGLRARHTIRPAMGRRRSSREGSGVRRVSFISASAALLAALLAGSVAAAPRSDPVRVLSVARGGEPPSATLDALERAGYRVHVALLPGTYWV